LKIFAVDQMFYLFNLRFLAETTNFPWNPIAARRLYGKHSLLYSHEPATCPFHGLEE